MPAPTIPSSLPQLLSVSEVAKHLGISTRTVWSFIAHGQLRTIRLGAKTVRVEVSEVQRFVADARLGDGS